MLLLANTQLHADAIIAGISGPQLVFAAFNRGTKEERAEERDEQWEAQQAVLKRRRSNSWQDVSQH